MARIKRRLARGEPIALAAVACILIGLSLYPDVLNWLYPCDLWNLRRLGIRTVSAAYGAVLAVAALVSYGTLRYKATTLVALCMRGMRAVVNEARLSLVWFCSTTGIRAAATWLVLITAVGAAVRCYFLAQPMRYDESTTFLNFINGGLLDLFYYPFPNNHVLHTLLGRLSVAVLGRDPVAIRLPAFVAGVCVIPMTFCLARLLTGSKASGFLASGLVAVFPYLVLYDTMARGYSLLTLLSLCLGALGFHLLAHPSQRACFLVALCSALGLFVMPSFAFPAAGIFLWLAFALVQQRHQTVWTMARLLVPCGIITLCLAGLLYTPTIIASNGMHDLYDNRFVRSLPWSRFWNRLPTHLGSSVGQFTRDIPKVVMFLGALLLGFGLYALVRNRRLSAFALFPALVLGGVSVLILKHAIPFDRTWIYAIPFTCLFVDAGFVGIVRSSSLYVRGILLLLAVGTALLLMNHDVIDKYPDGGQFREASVMVQALARVMNPGDEVEVKCPADAPVCFYLWQQGVPRMPIEVGEPTVPRKYFVVQKSLYTLSDLTKQETRKLLEIGDAELYVSVSGDATSVFRRP